MELGDTGFAISSSGVQLGNAGGMEGPRAYIIQAQALPSTHVTAKVDLLSMKGNLQAVSEPLRDFIMEVLSRASAAVGEDGDDGEDGEDSNLSEDDEDDDGGGGDSFASGSVPPPLGPVDHSLGGRGGGDAGTKGGEGHSPTAAPLRGTGPANVQICGQ